MIETANPKFSLGRFVATPGALEALAEAEQTPIEFIARHVRGNWGDVCGDDKQANADALQHGERVLSAYGTKKGVRLWIITEADRRSTCVPVSPLQTSRHLAMDRGYVWQFAVINLRQSPSGFL